MLTLHTFLLTASLAAPIQGGRTDLPSGGTDRRAPQPVLSGAVEAKGPAQAPRIAPGPRNVDGGRRVDRRPAASTDALPSTIEATLANTPHVLEHVFVDRPREADVWARGRTYKARMGGGSFDYIPFMGSAAPRNFPVRLQLEEVTVGEAPKALFDGPVQWSQKAFEQDRGPVIERYLLELDSVEQTFIVPSRPDAALSLRVGIETELGFEPQEIGAVYRGEYGAVRIGGASAVDSRGQVFPLVSLHAPEGYTISVPNEVLAAASYPLTIDPILNTFDVDTFAAELTCPSVSTHWSSGASCVVYTEDFSATDADVFCSLIDAADNATAFGYVDMTSDRWGRPDVGCAQFDGVMLVAAEVEEEVHARRLALPATSFDAVFRVDSGNYGRRKSDVSVGGDPADRWIVVFAREWSSTDGDVFARVIDSSGTPISPTEIVLDNTTANYRQPNASAHNGSLTSQESRWAVVAERHDTPNQSLEAAEIRWNGILDESFYSIYTGSQTPRFPLVSSPLETAGPRVFMTVFRRDFGSDNDIQATAFGGGTVRTTNNLSLGELPGDFLDQQYPAAIESNGSRFSLLWRDSGADRSWISTLVLFSNSICNVSSDLISGAQVAACSSLAPRTDPRGLDPHMIVLWEEESVAPTSIRAAVYNDYFACLGTSYCPPVPNSIGLDGQLYGEGTGIAGEPVTLHGLRLPPNQFCMFIVGRETLITPGPGGSIGNLCIGGPLGRFQNQIQNSGPSGSISLTINTAAIPTPLGPVAVQAGETWRFQAWHRDTSPAGATSNYTRGLLVPFN